MSEIIKPIITDDTGKSILNAILQKDITQQRINEINTAAEQKKAEVLASIPEDYSQLSESITEIKHDTTHRVLTFESGKYWTKNNGTGKVDKGSYEIVNAYEKIPVSVGDKFYIKCKGVGTAPTYIIADENMNWVTDGGADAIEAVITIPQSNAKYLCVNHLNNQTSVDFRLYLVSETTEGLMKRIKYEIGVGINDVRSKLHANIETATTVNYDSETHLLECGAYTYFVCGSKMYNVSNKTYELSAFSDGGYLFYDANNDMFVNSYTEGCYYMGAFWANEWYSDIHIDKKKFTINGMPVLLHNFDGKKLVCLGDSMTFGVGTGKPYHGWMKQLLNFDSVKTFGVSGSSIAPKTDAYPDWEQGIMSFYERYSAMDNNADIITVFGGVNDWVVGRELGTLTDRVSTTFCGAFRLMLEGLIAKYPHQRIYVFTSPQNDYINRPANIQRDNQYYGNTDGKNRLGYTQRQYMDAMISICKEYAITCYDMYRNLIYGLSGVLGDDKGTSGIYGSDGLHPNEELHKIIAVRIANVLISGNGDASKNYDDLIENVENEISKVRESISDISYNTKNLLNTEKSVSGICYLDGKIYADASYMTSDYIFVPKGQKIKSVFSEDLLLLTN